MSNAELTKSRIIKSASEVLSKKHGTSWGLI